MTAILLRAAAVATQWVEPSLLRKEPIACTSSIKLSGRKTCGCGCLSHSAWTEELRLGRINFLRVAHHQPKKKRSGWGEEGGCKTAII